MESKKIDFGKILKQQKTFKTSSYNNRKECIKKKTMELATLCGINACAIIYGAHGEIESWPENPKTVKAIIKQFKELTNNPYKRTAVKDESEKKVIDVPGGEVVSYKDEPDGESLVRKKLIENIEVVDFRRMVEKSSLHSRRSSLTEYQEFLKQLDCRLTALTNRIEFLKTDQQNDTNCCRVENKQLEYPEQNKQLHYSEETSPKRRKISEATLFPFDLNYPPPDEPECSSLSFENCNDLRNFYK